MNDFPNRPNYKIIEILGQGLIGSAYKVLNKENNCIYIIKKIKLKDVKKDELKLIKNEAEILSILHSKNIVKYFDFFEDKNHLI